MKSLLKKQWKLIVQYYGTNYKEEYLYNDKRKALNHFYLLEEDCCIDINRCYLFDPKGNLFYE
jgi:hypothetical protein